MIKESKYREKTNKFSRRLVGTPRFRCALWSLLQLQNRVANSKRQDQKIESIRKIGIKMEPRLL